MDRAEKRKKRIIWEVRFRARTEILKTGEEATLKWKELAYDIQQDQHLDEQSKLDLIDYFKTKVEEECDFKP